MSANGPIKEIIAGQALAVISLLVAREYLKKATAPRRPGLSLAEAAPPSAPGREAITVGIVYLALAAVGVVLFLHNRMQFRQSDGRGPAAA